MSAHDSTGTEWARVQREVAEHQARLAAEGAGHPFAAAVRRAVQEREAAHAALLAARSGPARSLAELLQEVRR
jgi:hypothetical protein